MCAGKTLKQIADEFLSAAKEEYEKGRPGSNGAESYVSTLDMKTVGYALEESKNDIPMDERWARRRLYHILFNMVTEERGEGELHNINYFY